MNKLRWNTAITFILCLLIALPVLAGNAEQAQIKQLLNKYENGVQLSEKEFDMIQGYIEVVQEGNIVYPTYLTDGTPTIVLEEHFTTGALPAGWQNVDNVASGEVWEFNNPGSRTFNSTTAGDGFAIFDSDNYGSAGSAENADMITPYIDCSGLEVVKVQFEHYFRSGWGGSGELFVSGDSGATWTSLDSWAASSTADAELAEYDITGLAAGKTGVMVKWNWQGDYSWYWLVDDVYIYQPGRAGDYVVDLFLNVGNPGGLNTDGDATTTGWTAITAVSQSVNSWSAIQTIPFPFKFYGNYVTHFMASQNGLVTFDTSTTLLPDGNENLPSASLPNNSIAVFWDNFTLTPPTSTNDYIYTKVFGTAPYRQLWIRWHSFEYSTSSYAYFACVLEESSNNVYLVDMNYFSGNVTSTVGMQYDNMTAVQYGDSLVAFGTGSSGYADNDYYKIHIPWDNDIGVASVDTSWTAGGSFYLAPGNPITVTAVIQNFSPNYATGFNVSYETTDGAGSSYSYTDTLWAGAIDTVTFATTWTPAAGGDFELTAYTSLIGDGNGANDAMTMPVTVFQYSLPYEQDFTAYSGSSNSISWFGADNADTTYFTPSATNDGAWTYDDFGNEPTLTRSARFNFYSTSAFDSDWLISPPMNMTTMGPGNQLIFDISATLYTGTSQGYFDPGDTLFIVASTDGQTWDRANVLGYFTQGDTIPVTGMRVQYDLSAWDAETSLFIGFQAYDPPMTGAADYNVYIDNFFVGVPPSVDVAVTDLMGVPSGVLPNSVIDFSIEITNVGQDSSFADTVDVFLNGVLTSSYGYATMAPLEKDTVEAMYTASASGTDVIVAALRLVAGDPNQTNDSLSVDVPVTPPVTTPFFENFQTGVVGTPGTLPAGWTNETDDYFDWYVDAAGTGSAGTGPDVDHTLGTAAGIYVFTESSSPNFPYLTANLTSPWLDLSTLSHPVVTFWFHMCGASMGDLHVDVFDGTTWHLDATVLSGPYQTATSDPWLYKAADLAGYGNTVKVRFRGVTGSSFTSDMAVDDVSIDEITTVPYDIIAGKSTAPVLSLAPITQPTILAGFMYSSSFANQAAANTGDITLEIYDGSGAVVHTDGQTGVTIPDFGTSSFTYPFDASSAVVGDVFNGAMFATNFTDTVPANDTSWAYSMTISDMMGYDQGNWAYNLRYTSATRNVFASRFDLLDSDVLSSVTLALGSGAATDSFSVDLYSSVSDSPAVMIHRIFRGTYADAGGPSATVTFPVSNLPLTAGDYWVVIDYDLVGSSYYPIGADNVAIPPSTYQKHFAMGTDLSSLIYFENSSFAGYTLILRLGLGANIPNLTIAEARADNNGDFIPDLQGQTVTITGLVTTPNYGTAPSADYFIQDATAGIDLYAPSSVGVAALNVGDEVSITGVIDIYNGKTEIIPAAAADVIVLTTGNALPSPQVITLAGMGEDYEGELVRINNAWLVNPAQWPNAGANANVDFTDGTDTLVIRVDKETDIDENPAPTGTFDLIAVGGQYDNTTPPDGGYQLQPRFYSDFIIPDPSVTFADNFDSYTAGVQLCLQTTSWIPWGGTPGAADDPLVSDAYSNSGPNSVVIMQNDDLVKDFGPMTSSTYSISFNVYIPTGKTGYFNTLAEFTLPSTFNWGMECYFNAGGAGSLSAGGAGAATFTWTPDTWQAVEVIVNLDDDMAALYFEGTMVYEWQWTLGASGGGSPLQLDANDFFGAAATDEMYFDDYVVKEIDPSVLFFDDFEAYTAGTQLCLQTTSWIPWGGTPGAADDPMVSNAYAYSGSNSVVIMQNDDLVKDFGVLTSGAYSVSFYAYIPTGNTGYFNTLAEFTLPSTYNWGMECYFNAGGAGSLSAGGTGAATFTWTPDTWQFVEVVVNLDKDKAAMYLDGSMVYEWQWTLGASGGGSPLQLDANDFFGAAATDEMYFDDYLVQEVNPALFFDDFEAYTAGTQLCLQTTSWIPWGGTPGAADDPVVSNAYAYSGVNSVVIMQNDDLVRDFGPYTSDVHSIFFMFYVPSGKSGYFNTLAEFTLPSTYNWGMECYFNTGGSGEVYGGSATSVLFNYVNDQWNEARVVVDLNQDAAEFRLNGTTIHQWTWTAGASGSGSPLQLDANDFFGAAATDEMYMDDYTHDVNVDTIIVGIGEEDSQLPTVFDIAQNYPNPFNPTTTIKYQLPKQSDVKIVIYNVLGQVVRTLVDNKVDAGYHQKVWDGMNEFGQRVSTGVYFYRMVAGDFVKSKKMILMK